MSLIFIVDRILELTNHPALPGVNFSGFFQELLLPSHQLGRLKLFVRVYRGEENG